MLKPGLERMRRLRFQGEKRIQDAVMIPATLPALLAVVAASEGLPWVLGGTLAASCYMESRATVVIEILVPDGEARETILGRVGQMPQGHEVRARTPEEVGLAPDTVIQWHAHARRDVVEGVTVCVPLPRDLFILLLAEPDVIAAPQAMYWACRMHLLHGPWDFDDVELSPYQRDRLGEAAAKIIYHVAGQLEALEEELERALEA
ncbi:MAG: hypothetical protein PWP23_3148 [Candidatus Sumerlaeota bacterium]|nr:hypothetical protein [Candidatus Sumerlaeota bacterium]